MSRTIIGFDVGIRNMSFCELTVEDSQHIAVKRWEVVDLMSGDSASANKINLEAANSRIVDVDVAAESSQLARYNILQQAGTAMLAQANTSQQSLVRPSRESLV